MTDIATRITMSLGAIGRPVTPEDLKARGQLRYGEDLLRQELNRLVERGQARRLDGDLYTLPNRQASTHAPAAATPPPPAPAAPAGPPIGKRILEAVKTHGPMRSSELAELLKLTPKQSHSTLYNLTRKGQLIRGTDRRYSLPANGARRHPQSAWAPEEDAILLRRASLADTRQLLEGLGSRRTHKAIQERRKRLAAKQPAGDRNEYPEGAPKPRQAPAAAGETPGGEATPKQEQPMPDTIPDPDSALPPRVVAELSAMARRITTPAHEVRDLQEKTAALTQLAELMRLDAPFMAGMLDAVRDDLARLTGNDAPTELRRYGE